VSEQTDDVTVLIPQKRGSEGSFKMLVKLRTKVQKILLLIYITKGK
jgi:hypothetical protein